MRICQSLLFVILAAALHAQTFRGALSGTVTDSSGAALPESAVKLENPSTGFARGTTSTGNGDFFFADLPLGMYTLTVSADRVGGPPASAAIDVVEPNYFDLMQIPLARGSNFPAHEQGPIAGPDSGSVRSIIVD